MRYVTITGAWFNSLSTAERRYLFRTAVENGWTIRVYREHWEN